MKKPTSKSDPLSIFNRAVEAVPSRSKNAIVRWSDWAMRLGIGGYGRETRRRLTIVNMAGYLSAVSSLTFVVNFSLYNFMVLKWLILGNLISAILTATAPFWHRYNSIASALVMTTTVAISLFFFVSELGRDSGIHLNYIGSVAIAFVIFGLNHLRIIAAVTVVCIFGNFLCQFLFVTGRIQYALDDAFITQLYSLSAATITIILAIVVWYAFRMAANAEARSMRLLNNVLPTTIAEQLREHPSDPIADSFDEATVLFADIVGFTVMSQRLKAGEMVFLLNELFSGFDAISERLGIEKIKTIGDAYMAVSGIPELSDDHAVKMIELAQAMLVVADKVSNNYDEKLELRIGIATGPITAGVIGKAKFAYDVWSPVVNLAARLESSSAIGKIHVSHITYRRSKHAYSFEKQPTTKLKGIGYVRSWFLKQKL